MKTFLKRLVLLLALVVVAKLAWDQRDRIALLSNNNFKIQGDWYQVELNSKGEDVYNFSSRIITRNGIEWGSYELRKNTRLEVSAADRFSVYHLDFPDDETMVWSLEVDGRLAPVMTWRR